MFAVTSADSTVDTFDMNTEHTTPWSVSGPRLTSNVRPPWVVSSRPADPGRGATLTRQRSLDHNHDT